MTTPSFAELVKMRAVLRLPGMEQASVTTDLPYKTIGDARLEADLYRPAGVPADLPLPFVVLVHGGPIPHGSRPQKMGVFVSTAQLLAASGLAAVAFNHRFSEPAMLLEAAGDVRDLLRFVRDGADRLGLDRDRLALWAYSGGGPLLSTPLHEAPAYLRALVAYYAILDLRDRAPAEARGEPGDLTDETRLAYSPAYHLATSGRGVPPLLVARAGRDSAWLNGTLDRFVAVALRRNAPIDLLNHPEGRHGFDILDDDARSREILSRTLAFLREHLVPPPQA